MVHYLLSNVISLSFSPQTGLKKLLRNPPMIKLPRLSDMITSHPLSVALPSAICEPLKHSKKEPMKLRGVTLYKEGSKPTGVWLIFDGIVKVTRN